MTNVKDYWDKFYASKRSDVLIRPSAFAQYVLSLVDRNSYLIDFGAGTGRDSAYFASNDIYVEAIDLSKEAARRINDLGKANLRAHQGSVELLKKILGEKDSAHVAGVYLYSRFVLHAMVRSEYDSFLSTLFAFHHRFRKVFLEYRVTEDRGLEKVYGEHFREYVDHSALVDAVRESGVFDIYSLSIGRGFSIYGNEDPFLGRLILMSR